MEEAPGSYGRNRPDITGEWQDGLDKSPNRLQMAPTAARTERGEQVVAWRNTFDPDSVLTATPSQILAFAQAIQEGGYGHLIKPVQ